MAGSVAPVETGAVLSDKGYRTDTTADTSAGSNMSIGDIERAEQQQATGDPRADFVHKYVSGYQAILIMVPVTLVYGLQMLDSSVVATAIPAITSEFESLLDIGWYGSAYTLASAAFQPLSGKIYTYFSTKWSFLAFFFVFELGSALCGAAQSSVMLIVGRAVAGLGGTGIITGALTILSAILPPRQQALAMGINVGIGQVGVALGPLLGGAFTEYVTWRWCFYINLPVGAVVAALLLFTKIPEAQYKPPVSEVLGTAVNSLDLPGFAMIAPAATMFFLALQYGGNQYAWNSSQVIGLFVGSAAMLVVFLIWERRQSDNAMVPLSMLSKRVIWSASGTMFFFMGALFCISYYLPVYFQSIKDDTPFMSGVHILPTIGTQVVFLMVAGVCVQTFGYYIPWVLAGTSLTVVAFGLLSQLDPGTSVGRWVGYEIIYGLGSGIGLSGPFIAIQNAVPAPQIPIAMAILTFSQYLGSAMFLTVAQTTFTNTLRSQLAANVPGVNADLIIEAGAVSIRQLVSGTQLQGVIQAYATAVDNVMYLSLGISIGAFLFAWGLGWRDIRKETPKNGEKSQTGPAENPVVSFRGI